MHAWHHPSSNSCCKNEYTCILLFPSHFFCFFDFRCSICFFNFFLFFFCPGPFFLPDIFFAEKFVSVKQFQFWAKVSFQPLLRIFDLPCSTSIRPLRSRNLHFLNSFFLRCYPEKQFKICVLFFSLSFMLWLEFFLLFKNTQQAVT